MSIYWDWWLGGLGLAFVAIGYHLTLGKTFGFSGMWERVLFKRETDALAEASALADDDDAFLAALLEMTEDAIADDDAGAAEPAVPAGAATPLGDGWWGHVGFILGVFGGGMIAAYSTGQLSPRLFLDDTFTGFFGTGLPALALLLAGGLMIGFGTRMAGGCTSGHGLNGCGRLQISSMVATASFFGTGIAVSWLLEILL